MSKTKAELEEQVKALQDSLAFAKEELETALKAANDASSEEIPEHGSNEKESKAERQARLQNEPQLAE